jgi:hypothetical protein
MPSLDIALTSKICDEHFPIPSQGPAPVTGVFPVGGTLRQLEIGLQAGLAFAISRGPTDSSPHTPGHESRLDGMLLSPFSFESRSAIGPWDITSNPTPLSGGYIRAPRGAGK